MWITGIHPKITAVVLIVQYPPTTFIMNCPKYIEMETIFPQEPLTCGSDISPMYVGSAPKRAASPIPVKNRER